MRPAEVLLWFANLLTFLELVSPGMREARWPRRLALLTLLIAAVQMLLEGARWQMFPIYGLSVLLFLVALARGPGLEEPSPARQMVARAGLWLGIVALLISAVPPIAFPVFHFPRPDGPYKIGSVTYHWVDAGRHEVFSSTPDARRELMVQVWYPAQPVRSAARAPYLPDGKALAPLARMLHLPDFIFEHLPEVMTDAVPYAPAADGKAQFPVLIFSHGRAGYRQHNTFQVESLVSHGYVVAAISHPYVAAGVNFPDGRLIDLDPRMSDRKFEDSIIPYLARDASFTLDQLASVNRADPNKILTGRLDMARVGMFGVSLGGAVTAETCARDSRLKACLPIDVFMPADVVRSGLKQPTMWISRDAATMQREGWARADIDETQSTMRAVFRSLPGDGYLVLAPGAFHLNFSDAPFLSVRPIAAGLGLIGPINPRRAQRILNDFSRAFFDRHLKGAPAPLLDNPAATYPEVVFQSRRKPAVNRSAR